MPKHLSTPVSRLICMGGAKASTNAIESGHDEDDVRLGKPE